MKRRPYSGSCRDEINRTGGTRKISWNRRCFYIVKGIQPHGGNQPANLLNRFSSLKRKHRSMAVTEPIAA